MNRDPSSAIMPAGKKSRKVVRKALAFAVAALLTVIVLAWATIDFWGRRQWNTAKNMLLTEGEPLSLSELLPPNIPDDQNFFSAPPWSEFVSLDQERRSQSITREEYSRRDPLGVLWIGKRADGSAVLLFTVGKRGMNLSRTADRLTDLEGFAQSYREQGLVADNEELAARAVLSGLERAALLLSDLEAAGRRPFSRAPLLINPDRPFETPLPHASPPLSLAQTLQLRAAARMAAGDSRGAAADILLILRMAEALRSDPFLISKLVRFSCLHIAISTAWECMAIGQWKPDEIEHIQRVLTTCNPVEDVIAGLRTERGLFNEWLAGRPSRVEIGRILRMMQDVGGGGVSIPAWFEWYVRLCPAGVFLADQAFQNHAIQERIEVLKAGNAEALSTLPPPPDDFWRHPFSSFALRGIAGLPARAFNTQSQVNLTVIACALERFRLDQGAFPTSLGSLVPQFLQEIPRDPVTREPIAYQLVSQDNYLLTCTALASEGNYIPLAGVWTWRRKL